MASLSYDEYERFFDLAKKVAKTHPFLVLSTFYDLSVSMCSEYPKNKSCSQVAIDLKAKVHHYISLLKNGMNLYPTCEKALKSFLEKEQKCDVKDVTAEVYGRQWRKFDFYKQFEYAREAVINRIQRNGYRLDSLKEKLVLDIGCGSGRFACALASFGAKRVIAYDWGDEGLELGARMAKELGMANITFEKGSILELPYQDEYFDFCFANGVFHHTEDLWKGLREQFRVMKKDGAGWLYIYGDGGFFWYFRKKMREVIRFIPESYTESFLSLIDHNENWFVPMDNWYVPIEKHTKREELESFLANLGYRRYVRTLYGLPGDRTLEFLEQDELAPTLFGEGDLRYLLYK